jgi:hypothetical protein
MNEDKFKDKAFSIFTNYYKAILSSRLTKGLLSGFMQLRYKMHDSVGKALIKKQLNSYITKLTSSSFHPRLISVLSFNVNSIRLDLYTRQFLLQLAICINVTLCKNIFTVKL